MFSPKWVLTLFHFCTPFCTLLFPDLVVLWIYMFATASSTIRILLHSPTMSNSESWRERGNHLLLADNQDMDLSERQVKLKMVIIMLFIPRVIDIVYLVDKILMILS